MVFSRIIVEFCSMKFRIYLFFVVFLLSGRLQGSSFNDKPDFSTREMHQSPRNVIHNHLYYLQKGSSYNVSKAARSFRNSNGNTREDLAIKLKQVYDGKGITLEPIDVPNDKNFIDTISGSYIYYVKGLKPRVYLEKVDGLWYYSEASEAEILKLHREVYPFGSDFFMNILPYTSNKKILSLGLWQWSGIALLLIAAFLAYHLFTIIFRFVIKKVGDYQIGKDILQPTHIRRFSKAFSLFVSFAVLKTFIPALRLNPDFSSYMVKFIDVFVDFFLLWTIWRGLELLLDYLEKHARNTPSTLDNQLVNGMNKLLKLMFIIAAIILGFRKVGVEIVTILAGLSISGLAVALAAQDVIRNLLGSINIFVDQPFQIGDFIEADNKTIQGTVEEVGLRSTRIRSVRDTIITAPNGKLSEMTVHNLGLRVFRLFKAEIHFDYDVPVDTLQQMMEDVKIAVKTNVLIKENSLETVISELTTQGVMITFSFFYRIPKGSKEILQKHEVFKYILKACESCGIKPVISN